MTETIKFGLALKALREARGWSACDLSTRAGLADYTVSRIETGKLKLDFSTAIALTEQLGVTLDLFASTAATLPSPLIEQEMQIVQARAEVKKLRRKTRILLQGERVE
jgi:transcriptional regulator with XRE-family HTH domain